MMAMTALDFSVDPNLGLIRKIIEARAAYENLCGVAPTVIYVNGLIKAALAKKGLTAGCEVAGMRIIDSPESIGDMAICSRDEDLFKPRGKGKK